MVASESGFEIRHQPQWLWQALITICLVMAALGYIFLIVFEGIFPMLLGIFVVDWVVPAILSTCVSIGILCGLARHLFVYDYAFCLTCQLPANCQPRGFSAYQYTCPHCGREEA